MIGIEIKTRLSIFWAFWIISNSKSESNRIPVGVVYLCFSSPFDSFRPSVGWMTEFLKYFDNIPFEFSGFSGLNRINHRIKQYSNIAITTYMKFISCNSVGSFHNVKLYEEYFDTMLDIKIT